MRSTRPIDPPHELHGQASVNQGVAIPTLPSNVRNPWLTGSGAVSKDKKAPNAQLGDRIQSTPKSFRVNTGDVVDLQARSNTWRVAQIKITVRVHQHVRRRDAHIRRACVRGKMCCKATKSRCAQYTELTAGTVNSVT
jgi:hypothetical protein